MPVFIVAFIGYVRFVIGQGRKLFWLTDSLSRRTFNVKRGLLSIKKLCRFFVKMREFLLVSDSFSGHSWMTEWNWLRVWSYSPAFDIFNPMPRPDSQFLPQPQ